MWMHIQRNTKMTSLWCSAVKRLVINRPSTAQSQQHQHYGRHLAFTAGRTWAIPELNRRVSKGECFIDSIGVLLRCTHEKIKGAVRDPWGTRRSRCRKLGRVQVLPRMLDRYSERACCHSITNFDVELHT